MNINDLFNLQQHIKNNSINKENQPQAQAQAPAQAQAQSTNELDSINRIQISPLLDSGQRLAVESIINNRLNILTGAAGTGKTFTVKEILKQLLADYSATSIFITAFTGKAVLNLVETFKGDPILTPFASQSSTIHKFLQFKPEFTEIQLPDGSFKRTRRFMPTYHSENLRRDCRILIIDEVSMVDKVLMTQLVTALDTAVLDKIILVGDINQLQPVIGSTSLADFAAHPSTNTAILSTIHRQADGNDIVHIADLIKKADLVKIKAIAKDNRLPDGTKLQNVRFLEVDNYIDLYKVIDVIVTKKQFDFNGNKDVIVTQTNVNATGQEVLNQRLNKYLKVDKNLVLCGVSNKLLGVGDNVLFSKNNYEQGYINGTFGTVLEVTPMEGIEVNNGANNGTNTNPAHNPDHNHSTLIPSTTDDSIIDSLLEEDEEMVKAQQLAETEDGFLATDASHSVRIGFTDIYGSYKEITMSSIGDLSSIILANAVTCYKAQGSTYDRVIVNLVDNKSGSSINNEYAYTAITRASQFAWVIYNQQGLNKIKSRQLAGLTDKEKIQNLVANEPNPIVTQFINKWLRTGIWAPNYEMENIEEGEYNYE